VVPAFLFRSSLLPMDYRHTQTGYLAALVIAWFVIVGLATFLLGGDEATAALAITAVVFVVLAAVVVWFNRLTVIVDRESVQARFGSGWPSRVFPMSEVAGFRRVRNKWYYGLGIRRFLGGWMYNVWGLDAVELALSDGKRFRIGTDEPDDLLAALTAYSGLHAG
jgi:hypothetical protein